MGLKLIGKSRQQKKAMAKNAQAVLELAPVRELNGRGVPKGVDPHLEVPLMLTYKEAGSLYGAYRNKRRKLERDKSRSTFELEEGRRDVALLAIERARALEARLMKFIESFPKEEDEDKDSTH